MNVSNDEGASGLYNRLVNDFKTLYSTQGIDLPSNSNLWGLCLSSWDKPIFPKQKELLTSDPNPNIAELVSLHVINIARVLDFIIPKLTFVITKRKSSQFSENTEFTIPQNENIFFTHFLKINFVQKSTATREEKQTQKWMFKQLLLLTLNCCVIGQEIDTYHHDNLITKSIISQTNAMVGKVGKVAKSYFNQCFNTYSRFVKTVMNEHEDQLKKLQDFQITDESLVNSILEVIKKFQTELGKLNNYLKHFNSVYNLFTRKRSDKALEKVNKIVLCVELKSQTFFPKLKLRKISGLDGFFDSETKAYFNFLENVKTLVDFAESPIVDQNFDFSHIIQSKTFVLDEKENTKILNSIKLKLNTLNTSFKNEQCDIMLQTSTQILKELQQLLQSNVTDTLPELVNKINPSLYQKVKQYVGM